MGFTASYHSFPQQDSYRSRNDLDVVVPSDLWLSKFRKERGVRTHHLNAGYSLDRLNQVYYDVIVVDDPKMFHMRHLIITVREEGRLQPLGFGDSRISHSGEYYDLNYFHTSGCFGSRNEVLPNLCKEWIHCKTGVPYHSLRLGDHNPGGMYNLLVLPEVQGKGVARNLIASSRQIAVRVGAKYFAHNANRMQISDLV